MSFRTFLPFKFCLKQQAEGKTTNMKSRFQACRGSCPEQRENICNPNESLDMTNVFIEIITFGFQLIKIRIGLALICFEFVSLFMFLDNDHQSTPKFDVLSDTRLDSHSIDEVQSPQEVAEENIFSLRLAANPKAIGQSRIIGERTIDYWNEYYVWRDCLFIKSSNTPDVRILSGRLYSRRWIGISKQISFDWVMIVFSFAEY